jgi:UDP-2,3-diacylglucosamine hydrolase
MNIPAGKKIYFASDFHLGVPTRESSFQREKKIINWLNQIEHDAFEIYLVGDIFDFWFEYKHAIPKGFARLQGKIAALVDSGISVYFFTGNHDMWMFDYFEKELGVKIIREPIERVYNEKRFVIGHGDGLGPGDKGYKFIKRVFAARWSQWLFARLHPNFGIGLANYFSRKSRIATGNDDKIFESEDKEWLVQYCREREQVESNDFYIFGHRHLPLQIAINDRATYFNLGEWIRDFTYAEFDGECLNLLRFEE